MYALRGGVPSESPAIGPPHARLQPLDPYPDLVCENHRTLSLKLRATAAIIISWLHLLL